MQSEDVERKHNLHEKNAEVTSASKPMTARTKQSHVIHNFRVHWKRVTCTHSFVTVGLRDCSVGRCSGTEGRNAREKEDFFSLSFKVKSLDFRLVTRPGGGEKGKPELKSFRESYRTFKIYITFLLKMHWKVSGLADRPQYFSRSRKGYRDQQSISGLRSFWGEEWNMIVLSEFIGARK